MLAGLDGRDATQSVVALATGALHPPAGVAYEEQECNGHAGHAAFESGLCTGCSHLQTTLPLLIWELVLPPPLSQADGRAPKHMHSAQCDASACRPAHRRVSLSPGTGPGPEGPGPAR